MNLIEQLPAEWRAELSPHLDAAATTALGEWVAEEYATQTIYPPVEDLFSAYRLCSPSQTRVLILGQDPYHGPGQAHGLSFSVREGVRRPPSLSNIFKELNEDLNVPKPPGGDLTGWARQGVLLLNAVLTVRAGKAGSHANKGWEAFTDATIKALNERDERIVFLLWGSYARKKAVLVTNPAHAVLEAGHPSPLNRVGFLGSRPFSAANKALADGGRPVIDWDPRATV
ncbi:uracil-DNA glycosylase [Actinoplanes philippinensis]|uniref:Uracil-DNA glycosylase n=1 Tax=Actinoplanes philippinensis TaxID=35752 RepID=A0A1I2ISJ2_9ACTN|nr:uracil-DNA glycosylase [Actinoplanes philippinensis]GIE79173.1 uracil-DNA glycosylase [Actinoplanes philippinensis]SFF43491.1 uracil-DNA glycosylase [Actinoplanes philippinensis]